MSDIIKLLPDHVANQIAAGEVIQRPSSVVKELLENAIDAGGNTIKLSIKDGGKTFIQVTDNGKGMSATDARMCWERHATSKINSIEDIFKIRTMGFRGEALASIASVAMVELKTKRLEDSIGTQIKIQGSEVKSQEGIASLDGTSLTIRNLFYNIPARRNFLKSDAVETRHIMDEFVRIALAHPEVNLSMYHNENESYILHAGNLALRIKELFSIEENKHIIPVSEETSLVSVSGFMGKPEYAKKTRGEQFFFVNNRFIKDAYLNHAVVSCYDQLIQKDQFPFYILNIEIDPAQIDVNVHPTKTEIKFEDERAIYQIIKATGKKALGQHYHVSGFEPAGNDMYMNLGIPNAETQTRIGNTDSSGNNSNYRANTFTGHADPKDWKELFQVISKQEETIGDIRKEYSGTSVTPQVFKQESTKHNMMQLHQTYVIVQVRSGILLIDQQAAHKRILFEKYLEVSANSPIATQQKLFPKSIQVTVSDEKLLKELLPEIRMFGIDISEFGKQTFIVSGLPPEMDSQEEIQLVQSFIEDYKQQSYSGFKPHERIARILADKLCIGYGKSLTSEEMAMLVDELFACKEPNYSPDGKKCFKTISLEELGKMITS